MLRSLLALATMGAFAGVTPNIGWGRQSRSIPNVYGGWTLIGSRYSRRTVAMDKRAAKKARNRARNKASRKGR